MSDPISFDLVEGDRLADPPLLDFFHYEPTRQGYSITFIPSFGDEATCFVFIERKSVEGRRVEAMISRIESLVGSAISKVIHQGGGDLSLEFTSGASLALSDAEPRDEWAPEVFDRLKQIAEIAEASYCVNSKKAVS